MTIGTVAAHLLLAAALGGQNGEGPAVVPVLYSTDLHHPHQDPDDHFDLATLFALEEFDVRGILLDCGARQVKQPGRIPLEQMMHLAGRKVPFAVGLERPLASPDDAGRDQPAEFQEGVTLILDVLRQSKEKVTIFTTGSLRDVAAALNRRPELFRRKVGRLYVNIGDARGGKEYNVGLDRQAFVRVMRSGLPVFWCPCFDGGVFKQGRGYATYWVFRQDAVLETCPPGVQNFFIYALDKPQGVDPIEFLTNPQDPGARKRIWALRRNMWCTGPMLHAAGRRIVPVGPDRWAALPAARAPKGGVPVYRFAPAQVSVTDDGSATLGSPPSGAGHQMHCFSVLDQASYDAIMTCSLRGLLAEMLGVPNSRQGRSLTP